MLRDVLTQKGLSNREAEVAELVVKGLSNKEVANQLFVTEKTVKFHLTNIYKKMNVKSRAQLIVWCMPYQSFVEGGSTENAQSARNLKANSNTGIIGAATANDDAATDELAAGAANAFTMPIGLGNRREPGSDIGSGI